ncbi:MAG: hypothetical protein ACRCTU_08265 [Zoogloea sp.]|uniref:hypothetical protein n=1 Tax=Zoogloea sp. TaxID=49181 RepID=UPI003F3AD047
MARWLILLVQVAVLSLSWNTRAAPADEANAGWAFRPNIHPGDRWVFQARDEVSGEVVRTISRLVYQVTDNEVYVKTFLKSRNSSSRIEVFDRELNPVDSEVLRFSPHGADYDFPLYVGKVWDNTFEVQRARQEGREVYQVSATVVAYETIKVPAGEFPAYKIEYAVRKVSPAKGEGLSRSTRWYAPDAKQMVRYEPTVPEGESRQGRQALELVNYTATP